MSRNIKFRAYIEDEHRFIYCADSDDNYLGTFFTAVRQMEKMSGKKIPVEQFTGRAGKNGKEIDDGDTVKLAAPEARPHELELAPQQVVWMEDGYFIKGASGIAVHPRRWHVYEVIGNIYENVDLISERS